MLKVGPKNAARLQSRSRSLASALDDTHIPVKRPQMKLKVTSPVNHKELKPGCQRPQVRSRSLTFDLCERNAHKMTWNLVASNLDPGRSWPQVRSRSLAFNLSESNAHKTTWNQVANNLDPGRSWPQVRSRSLDFNLGFKEEDKMTRN